MNPEMHTACSALPPATGIGGDPLRLESAWLGETALSIAKGIAADTAFDRLPILADALEDAGCDNRLLLDHFRFGEPHQVGCWALRLLLRTTLILPGGVPMTFAWCPPGSFQMGSEHPAGDPTERPVHSVTLTRGFYSGIYPVTQAEWCAVMNLSSSHFVGDNLPVQDISWKDAQKFCKRARKLTGRAIRLPAEAEWEYACRAGTTTEYYFGDTISNMLANYDATRSWNGSAIGVPWNTTTAVGTFPANPWGLYDTHGNVWEWCEDGFDKNEYQRNPVTNPKGPKLTHHVCRGGAWNSDPGWCRAASRNRGGPSYRKFQRAYNLFNPGFRVVFCAD